MPGESGGGRHLVLGPVAAGHGPHGRVDPDGDHVERERARDVERERTRELASIGNNFNQIARWANEHKSAADAAEVSRHLAATELALRDLAASARRA